MKHALYVIGEPGSGKSTLVEELTAADEAQEREVPFAHRWYPGTYPEAVIELGKRRDTFPGTDALSFSVQPKIEVWLAAQPVRLMLAEGDRLANARFFDHLIEAGWNLVVARLRVKPETAATRREQRDARHDASWVASRQTKVNRLGALYPERTINVWHEDGGTEEALRQLRERSPVADAFTT